jgi:hypothetical protein
VALDLAAAYDHPNVRTLLGDVVPLTEQDCYAARDALGSAAFSDRLTAEQIYKLRELVRNSGLRSGAIPARLHDQLKAAVERAATALLADLARLESLSRRFNIDPRSDGATSRDQRDVTSAIPGSVP